LIDAASIVLCWHVDPEVGKNLLNNVLSVSLRRLRRHIPAYCAMAATVLVVVGLLIYLDIRKQGVPVYHTIGEVPEAPVAIVFGAGIGSAVLADRVKTAVDLYKSGKVRKILMTGDNSHVDYNEPNAMRSLAVASGVANADIACDCAGFRTYDSLYRARNIFDVTQAVLVTQAFHQPRAIYIAKHLGISVVGIDAARQSYGIEQCFFELREVVATEAAWLDVFTRRKPKFLGKKERWAASIHLDSETKSPSPRTALFSAVL
jgi:SanA protein